MHAPFAHIYIPTPPYRKKSCIRPCSGPGYKARGPSAEEDSVDLKLSTQYVVYTILCTLSSFMTKRPPWSILYCRVEQVNEIIQAYNSGKIAIVDQHEPRKCLIVTRQFSLWRGIAQAWRYWVPLVHSLVFLLNGTIQACADIHAITSLFSWLKTKESWEDEV